MKIVETINLYPHGSTAIKSFSLTDNSELVIEWVKGKKYLYDAPSGKYFEGLKKSLSKGYFVNYKIKSAFDCREIS